MTAPRAREQSDPPSPPDRRPPRRGGDSSPSAYAASAAGRAAGRARPRGARRGLVRSARAVAAAALLALTGSLALPASAEAQTVTALVSNLDQTANTATATGIVSQNFTTGSDPSGYTLFGVDVVSATATPFSVWVCNIDDSGNPLYPTSCVSLLWPGSFTEGWVVGTNSHTADLNVRLAEDTTYTVVLVPYESDTHEWGGTSSGDEDTGFVAPWSIADESRHWVSEAWSGGFDPFRIAIKGYAGERQGPRLSISDAEALEGDTLTFTVTLPEAAASTVTVDWRMEILASGPVNESLANALDLTNPQTGSLEFPPGTTTKTLTVSTTEDTDVEPDEVFSVTLENPVNATLRHLIGFGTILNDDGLTLRVANASGGEADGVTFTATLSATSAQAVTATWTASVESYDTATESDLATTKTGMVTVAENTTTMAFTVAVTNDSVDEEDETFTVTLSGVSSHASLGRTTARGTIVDDDPLPELSVEDVSAAEGNSLTFTVTLDPVSGRTVKVDYSAAYDDALGDTTADDGSDFTAASGTLTFNAGTATQTFTVDTTDDTTAESNETFTVTLSDAENATISDATAKGTITNNDGTLSTDATLSALSVTGGGSELVTNFASGTATYTASVANSVDEVTVTPTTNDASADGEIQDADGNALADADTNAAGHQVALAVGANVIKAKVTAADGTSTQTYTVTVTRAAALPSLSIADSDGAEDEGVEFMVTLSAAAAANVTATWTASIETGDSATAADLATTKTGEVTVLMGSTAAKFTVPVEDDSTDEEDQTFTVTLSGVSTNAQLAADPAARGTIEDDDPTPTVTVADAAATEGDKVEFVVTLSAVSGRDVDVDYATSVATGDDATSGTDFTAASGTLTIAAADNTATGTIEVQTTEDDASESAETFTLTLSNPDNATLTTDTTATGTINNRASTDATLSGLAVNDGSSDLTLTPAFASGTTSYTASVGHAVDEVTVTPTKGDSNASIEYLDKEDSALTDANTTDGFQVALPIDSTTIKVKVTAEDDTTTRTYMVIVTRPAEALTPPADALVSSIGKGILTWGEYKAFSQNFTTGSNASGYTLSGVDVASASSTAFTAQVCTANPDTQVPTSTCTALTAPGSFALGAVSFTAPANTVLVKDTLYAVVVTATGTDGTQGWGQTSDNGEDAGSAAGWSIRDNGHYRNPSHSTQWPTTTSVLRMAVRGSAVNGTPSNNAPVFDPATATREVAENSAAGTNVGAAIPEATDADSGDTLTYSMEGTDAASFAFDASTRQITTITGVTYNYEATKNTYSVTVKASDGTDSGALAVTIDVTDVNEKSAKPDKPTLAAVTGSSTSLTATWTKPDLDGGPDIAGYEVQYREGTTGDWEDSGHTGSGLTTTITGLTADTSYQARVRAKNGETDSDWSDPSDAVKTNAAAAAPTISAVAVTSTPVLETDTYGAGETIEVSVTFDEAVNATSDTDFVLSVAGAKRAPLVRGSGTATLVFGYTVVSSDEDDDGIWIGDQDRTLVGNRNGDPQNGTITSLATSTAADLTHAELGQQSDHKVDGSRSIVSVAVSSTPMLETDTYGAGETIRFTVTFNVAVDVSGDPVLAFALGNQGDVRDVDAAHESGSGTTALVFAYTVVSTDEDNNGIFLRDENDFNNPDGPVRLDSDDTIQFTGTSTDVPLYWQGRGTQSGHKVDGSRTTGNNAPVFADASETREVAENSAAGTNVGAVIPEATDADSGDTLTYSMAGTDAASFDFNASTRQITTITGVDYDFEATQNTYEVTVKAVDGNGGTATVDVTIDVTDVNEKSAKPDKPTLAAVTDSSTTLTATWTKPDLDGGPDIAGYAVEYRQTGGSWTNFAHTGTAVTTTITGLTANTEYRVRVQAKNGEGDSDWSDASDAVRTNAVDIQIPPGLEVTLHLSDDEPLEDTERATVTATVSPASPVPFTVTISATPVAPATGDDFTLSANRGAELRRGRDREHRDGDDQAGWRRRPRAE